MSATEQAAQKPVSKWAPRERSLNDIVMDLRAELPASMLKTKPLKGSKITFIEWHSVVRLLDYYAPGWMFEVRSVAPVGSEIGVVGRLTLVTADGDFYREATGSESTDEEDVEKMYGTPMTNSEAQAFKRAASKWGVGLYLYGASR